MKKNNHGGFYSLDDEDIYLLDTNPSAFWQGISKIDGGVFSFKKNLTKIEIPEYIKFIDDMAFYGCHNLKKITVDKDNNTYHSDNNCLIQTDKQSLILSIDGVVPYGVKEIKDNAFININNGIDELIIPETVISIGQEALTNVEIKKISVDENNPIYYVKDGCLINKQTNTLICGIHNTTIPDGVSKIGLYAFCTCSDLQHIKIPASVTEIDTFAFVEILNSIETIEVDENNPIFRSEGNCLIEKATGKVIFGCKNSVIPNGVTSIAEYAFFRCSLSQEFIISNGIEVIENNAFQGTSISKINIPSSVKIIGYNAFEGTSISKINIPSSVKIIESNAFSDCLELEEVSIENGIEEIKDNLFANCSKLKSIKIPETVKNIGIKSFSSCSSLIEINIPDSVEKIEPFAFEDCLSLKKVIIPKQVKSIGSEAFRNCSNLEEVIISPSVKEINHNAFSGCSKIKSITIPFEMTDHFIDLVEQRELNELSTIKIINSKGIETYFKPNTFKKDIVSLCKKRETQTTHKSFNTLCLKFDITPDLPGYHEFYKFCYILGLMEPDSEIITKGNNSVKVRDIAYTLLQGILKEKSIKFSSIRDCLQSAQLDLYNRGLLEFLTKDKKNYDDFIKNIDNFSAINKWFYERQNLQIPSDFVVDTTLPTKEENRYKVCLFTQSENGQYKEHWNAPTIKNILQDMSEKIFTGVHIKTQHIADVLSEHGYKEQKFFDKAVEIDEERKNLVSAGKLKNNILDTPIKSNNEVKKNKVLQEYIEKTENIESQIVDNLLFCTNELVECRESVFNYEMLDKSSEEIFVMGNLTSCCAKLFDAGSGAQRAMIVHPDIQPLVIRDKNGTIVAFSIIYVNREKGYAVLNDVEVNSLYDDNVEDSKKIYESLMDGVVKFTEEYNKEFPNAKIERVHCGISPRTGNSINSLIRNNPRGEILKAINFNDYSYEGIYHVNWSGDWFKQQYVLLDKTEGKESER